MQAYDASRDLEAMAAALGRNVYRGGAGCEANSRVLAYYVFSARDHLARSNVGEGMGDFGPLPGEPEP
jgi:hypothetical protein